MDTVPTAIVFHHGLDCIYDIGLTSTSGTCHEHRKLILILIAFLNIFLDEMLCDDPKC